MKRTPEQVKADEELNAAIKNAVEAYGVLNGAMLVDFMVIIEGVHVDREDRDEHGILFRDNICRTTVALGLIEKAGQIMQWQDIQELDEKEEEDTDGEGQHA